MPKPNDLLRLAQARTQPWFRVETARAESDENETSSANLYIYDVVGWDPWPSDLARELDELEVDQLNVFINSPGGYASDGVAIYNLLRRHSARVVVTVDGLAASAASVIAMAGDEVIMATGSQMMVHDAWGYCVGNAADMQAMAGQLEQLCLALADIYTSKAGGDRADWRQVMAAETWYNADEAVAAGLADRTASAATGTSNQARAAWDLSIFAHAGRADAPAPPIPVRAAAAIPPATGRAGGTPNPHQEGTTMPTLNQGIRERLGINADADIDDDGILAALDEVLGEQADPTPAATFTPPAGTTLVDEGTFAQLQADASAGREARNAQIATDRENAVLAAISDGRIAPARADHWRESLAADPGAIEVLNALPKGTVPAKPVGATGGTTESSDEDATYNRVFPTQEG